MDGFGPLDARRGAARGTYRFTTYSDDGIRSSSTGEDPGRLIDRGETRDDVDVPLAAGKHTIVFEYYENTGMASARLFWNALNYSPVLPMSRINPSQAVQTVDVVAHGHGPRQRSRAVSLENAPVFVTIVNADRRSAAPRCADQRRRSAAETSNFSLRVVATDARGGRTAGNSSRCPFAGASSRESGRPSPPPPPAHDRDRARFLRRGDSPDASGVLRSRRRRAELRLDRIRAP